MLPNIFCEIKNLFQIENIKNNTNFGINLLLIFLAFRKATKLGEIGYKHLL